MRSSDSWHRKIMKLYFYEPQKFFFPNSLTEYFVKLVTYLKHATQPPDEKIIISINYLINLAIVIFSVFKQMWRGRKSRTCVCLYKNMPLFGSVDACLLSNASKGFQTWAYSGCFLVAGKDVQLQFATSPKNVEPVKHVFQ